MKTLIEPEPVIGCGITALVVPLLWAQPTHFEVTIQNRGADSCVVSALASEVVFAA